jgi:uncharacterized protein (TIGR02145 family)
VNGGGRGICPKGWHIPAEKEWVVMLDKVEGDGTGTVFANQTSSSSQVGINAGVKLKSAATYTGVDPGNGAWLDHANRGSNASGFMQFLQACAILMARSSTNGSGAWCRDIYYHSAGVSRVLGNRSNAFSVRCVKD